MVSTTPATHADAGNSSNTPTGHAYVADSILSSLRVRGVGTPPARRTPQPRRTTNTAATVAAAPNTAPYTGRERTAARVRVRPTSFTGT